MQKLTKVLVGLLVAGIGFIYALNALEITDINLFFDGWWTLFIIVPCVVSLFTTSDKTASLIGIAVGVGLLLSAQGIIEFRMIFKLFIPVIIIILGLRIAFDDVLNKKKHEISEKVKDNNKVLRNFSAVMTSTNADLSGQQFDGAIVSAVFGSVGLNAGSALISEDIVIKVTSVFGNVDITVPEGVNVRMSSNSFFADTRNVKRNEYPGAPTVYVKCVSVFGGVEVR